MPRRHTLAAVFATILLTGSIVAGTTALEGSGATAAPRSHCHRHHGTCPTSPSTSPSSVPTSPSSVPTSPSSVPTSPSSSATGGGGFSCTVPIGGGCGAYLYPGIPNSNGYNTYVVNQAINVHGTGTLSANDPGDWQAVENLADCGGCVQVYAHVQQLLNNWGGGGWDGALDTPVDALSTLKINYDETSPATGAAYEYAPDIWTDGYPNDVMFWTDTLGRCDEGAFGGTLLGHATFGGQDWTVHRYGGTGAEIIFVLDGPGGSGTCARQSSGTIDIKAGLAWLSAIPTGSPGGDYPDHPVLSIVASGWEIAQASNATFTMHSYSITAGVL